MDLVGVLVTVRYSLKSKSKSLKEKQIASYLRYKYSFENTCMREIGAQIFSNDYVISSASISTCPTRHIFTKSYLMKMDAQHFQVPQAKSKITYLETSLKVRIFLI